MIDVCGNVEMDFVSIYIIFLFIVYISGEEFICEGDIVWLIISFEGSLLWLIGYEVEGELF